ncbi:MAG: hypothetical protein LBG74_00245 [Spirochaetaceae bacterium]|jgi:hypothetical protein|nr:hypothetical protein [Spirochaetaceae bacterium]
MKFIWERDRGIMRCVGVGVEFTVTCDVRNEVNDRRKLHNPDEVVHTVRADGTWGHAYMPRPFPKGEWKITEIEKTSKPVFAPVKIKTEFHPKLLENWAKRDKNAYAFLSWQHAVNRVSDLRHKRCVVKPCGFCGGEHDGFEGTVLVDAEEHSDNEDNANKLYLSVAEIQFTVPAAMEEEIMPIVQTVKSDEPDIAAQDDTALNTIEEHAKTLGVSAPVVAAAIQRLGCREKGRKNGV